MSLDLPTPTPAPASPASAQCRFERPSGYRTDFVETADDEFEVDLTRLRQWRSAPHNWVEIEGFPARASFSALWPTSLESFLSFLDNKAKPSVVYIAESRPTRTRVARAVDSNRSLRMTKRTRQMAIDAITSRLDELGRNDAVTGFAIGFTADGVLHYFRSRTSWLDPFFQAEINDLSYSIFGFGQPEDHTMTQEQREKTIERALQPEVQEKIMSNRRMLACRSREEMVKAFEELLHEEIPETTTIRLRTAGVIPLGIFFEVGDRRERLVESHLKNLALLAEDFLAWPPTKSAHSIGQKLPLAKLFVEQKLGFKHVPLADALVRWKPADQ
jgi:hypothetical protein